jgi:hypothetical protein
LLCWRPMTTPLRATLLAAFLLTCAAAAAEPPKAPGTTLTVTAELPPSQDYCLDHSVKELGMSATKVEGERRWVIGPQFLHPSVVAGGAFGIRFDKGEKATALRVTATWPGGKKEPALQTELESRVVAMMTKTVQLCGSPKAAITCTVQAPGAAAEPCTGK